MNTTTAFHREAQSAINAYLAKHPTVPTTKARRSFNLPFSATTFAWFATGATLLGGACWMIGTIRVALGA